MSICNQISADYAVFLIFLLSFDYWVETRDAALPPDLFLDF